MSDRKKDEHGQKHKDHDQQEHPASHSGDLVDYDPDKAQDMIEIEEAAEHANQVSSPNPKDPQRPDQGVPPNQENVSRGFTSGRGMQGGSANRRKR